jgi:ubiquinone/menaquinone biosynthesis C-methylase UbiE
MSAKVTSGYPRQYKHLRLAAWGRLAVHWAEYIQHDSFHRSAQRQLLETVLKDFPLSGNEHPSLVDLGCGTGQFLRMARTRGTPRWERLVGIDFCPQMLKLAKESDVSDLPRLRFFEIDLEVPIENGAANNLSEFDVATAIFLLDEIENIDTCFASASSIIRSGGHLTCGTLDYSREMQRHSAQILQEGWLDKILVVSNSLPRHRTSGTYYRIMRNVESYQQSAEQHGFQLVRNIALSPAELHSRPDGPGLRLLTWQKTIK